jgi:hypothetical protein
MSVVQVPRRTTIKSILIKQMRIVSHSNGLKQRISWRCTLVPVLVLFTCAGIYLLCFTAEPLSLSEAANLRESGSVRLDKYCSEYIRKGDESEVVDTSGIFQLRHLLISIRHGDRSRIHSFPNSSPLSVEQKLIDPLVLSNKLDKLAMMRLEPMMPYQSQIVSSSFRFSPRK